MKFPSPDIPHEPLVGLHVPVAMPEERHVVLPPVGRQRGTQIVHIAKGEVGSAQLDGEVPNPHPQELLEGLQLRPDDIVGAPGGHEGAGHREDPVGEGVRRRGELVNKAWGLMGGKTMGVDAVGLFDRWRGKEMYVWIGVNI